MSICSIFLESLYFLIENRLSMLKIRSNKTNKIFFNSYGFKPIIKQNLIEIETRHKIALLLSTF